MRSPLIQKGIRVTDKPDQVDDEHRIPGIAAFPQDSINDESDDEFADDEGSESMESLGEELTPNDIFGLDPLDVLTLEELADYLKVSTAVALRAIKEQNLPGRNIAGEWRFLRDAVANWLRGQEEPAQQQQRTREEYSKHKSSAPAAAEGERFSQGASTSYSSEQSGGGEYRPRKRFPEGGQQKVYQGGSQGGGQYGNRGGQGQYGSENQYGGSGSTAGNTVRELGCCSGSS